MKVYVLTTSADGLLGIYGSYSKALEAGKQYASGVYGTDLDYDQSALEIHRSNYTTRIYGMNEATIETEMVIR